MKYRHEWKYEINNIDRLILLTRLSAVMKQDTHAVGGMYRIRSLYFDTPDNKALREKVDGVNYREKFRKRFVFAPGNVRVTIDRNICTGLTSTDFLNPNTPTASAGESKIILEVKCDDYIPDIIKDAVTLPGRRSTTRYVG